MNILHKLTFKNLKLNKKRTIVTIIGIILSVALITAVASMYSSLIASMIKYEKYEKGNFHVAFYEVPQADLKTFKSNREIEDFYLTEDLGYAKYEKIANPGKPYLNIKGFNAKSLENLAIKLVEGRLPENSEEIVIPTHLKTNGRVDLKIGDTLTLEVGKRIDKQGNILNQSNPYQEENLEQIIDRVMKTFKIVGIIERPANNVEAYSAPGYTLITYSDLSKASLVDVYTRLTKKETKDYITYTAGILEIDPDIFQNYVDINAKYESHLQAVEAVNKAKYQININQYLVDLETNPFHNSSLGEMGMVVLIVCVIIVVTSVFCIKNSFDISITEKTKQYGMLRSIGATKKQIRKNVFFEATILGLIGIPIGLLCGLLASYILVFVCNYFLAGSLEENLEIIFAFSYLAIIVAIILGMLTIYLSALRSARRAAKVSPIDSIRNSADLKIKRKKVKSNKLVTKLFGIGGDLSYKNIKRNKKKYRTTTISIITSVTVFIALSSFMNLAFKSVEGELNLQDYNLSLGLTFGAKTKDKIKEIEMQENINDYIIERMDSIRIVSPKYNSQFLEKINFTPEDEDESYISIMAIGDIPYQKYLKKLGLDYEEVKNKGILLDKVTINVSDGKENMHTYRLRKFNYQAGDEVKASDGTFQINLALITDKLPMGISESRSNSIIIVSDAVFEQYFADGYTYIFIDSSDAAKTQDAIDKIMAGEEYSLENIEENAKIMQNLFTLIGIFLYGFIIVISLIGITNIFNTITTSMELRKGEFAMLKSIGMTTKEFNHMIRLESIFIGLKSLLWGIPLGIVLSVFIYHTGDMDYAYEVPILAIILAILVVFLLITLIMKYSLHKIKGQNTIETIRNENI